MHNSVNTQHQQYHRNGYRWNDAVVVNHRSWRRMRFEDTNVSFNFISYLLTFGHGSVPNLRKKLGKKWNIEWLIKPNDTCRVNICDFNAMKANIYWAWGLGQGIKYVCRRSLSDNNDVIFSLNRHLLHSNLWVDFYICVH